MTGTKISKAKLLMMVPVGTKLTLTHTSILGNVNKKRTVIKSTNAHLVLEREEAKDGDSSYLYFKTGDQFFHEENGFTVQANDGNKATYVFGH